MLSFALDVDFRFVTHSTLYGCISLYVPYFRLFILFCFCSSFDNWLYPLMFTCKRGLCVIFGLRS